jgi:hypothetical protein
MAQGLSLPVRAFRGRAALSSGSEKNDQVISLCILDGDNNNPFNDDVGLTAPIFKLDSASVRAQVELRIKTHFDRLYYANRIRLLKIEFTDVNQEGDLRVNVRYIDLETDEELEAVYKIA